MMQICDIPFGMELCKKVGWNQTQDDWRRLINLGGVLLAMEDGVPCGTGSVIQYETRLGWIGMILVNPEFRGHGIGSAIMNSAIQYLKERNIDVIKLDATDAGRRVYLKLGFKDERLISRYKGVGVGVSSKNPPADVSVITDVDWDEISEIDKNAFGANRIELLKQLKKDGVGVLVRHADKITGFGFARAGMDAHFVGPIVADNLQIAQSIAKALVAQFPESVIYWDILPDNFNSRKLVETLGFKEDRKLMRMLLSEGDVAEGDINKIFGGAGFELG